MAVARVTEISATSTASFEDAIRQGLERGSQHESAFCVRQTGTDGELLSAIPSVNQPVRLGVASRSVPDAAVMAGKPCIPGRFPPAGRSEHFRVVTSAGAWSTSGNG
jgi:hypothetical protein